MKTWSTDGYLFLTQFVGDLGWLTSLYPMAIVGYVVILCVVAATQTRAICLTRVIAG